MNGNTARSDRPATPLARAHTPPRRVATGSQETPSPHVHVRGTPGRVPPTADSSPGRALAAYIAATTQVNDIWAAIPTQRPDPARIIAPVPTGIFADDATMLPPPSTRSVPPLLPRSFAELDVSAPSSLASSPTVASKSHTTPSTASGTPPSQAAGATYKPWAVSDAPATLNSSWFAGDALDRSWTDPADNALAAHTRASLSLASEPLASSASSRPTSPSSLLWMPSDVEFSQLIDASLYPPQYSYTATGMRKRQARTHKHTLGVKRTVNGTAVAIYKYKGKPLVFSAVCPHAYGDLSLGDIEEYDGHTCVTCPRHGFLFECKTGGKSILPPDSYKLDLYPARVNAEGRVEIKFSGLSAALFTSEDF